jgi:tetratricopeptide (TPR) repeat protein
MKCLEKDRNRRYETASGLANDIQRHLNDEPVLACPPSTRYRVAKFATRNKSLLAAGGAIAAALTFGLGLTTWQYFRASTESARAKAVSNLLQEMLGSADASRAKGVDYKVRELLDDFSTGLGSQLTSEPEVAADIHATIGRAYRSVQHPDRAQPHFEKAIELRWQVDGAVSEQLADILVDYAWNLRDQQRYSESESRLNEALEIYRQLGVTGAPVFHALEILQHVLISSKRDVDAERVTKEALQIASQSGEAFPDQANLLHRYADLKIRQGHFAEGEKLASQAVDMHRRLHGDEHPETAFGLRTLSRALVPQKKLAEAEATVRESLSILRRQLPEDHPIIRSTIGQLRTVLEARGDKSALDALAKEEAALAMRSDMAGYHARLAESLLADKSQDGATTEVARQLIQRALEEYGQVPVDWPDNLDRRLEAAQGYVNLVETCAAAPGFSNEVDELNHRLEAELPKIAAAAPEFSDAQFQAAIKYRDWGFALSPYPTNLPTVEHAYRESIKILEKLPLSDPRRPGVWTLLVDSYLNLAAVQWRSAKPGDANASITQAKEILDQHVSVIAADPVYDVAAGTAIHVAQLALSLASTHREDEAAEYVRKAAEAARHVKEPADLVNALGVTAIAQLRLGDQSGYRATCKTLVDVVIAGADDLSNGRAISACCLSPDALDDLTLLVKRAESFAAHNSLEYRHVGPYLLGAALFRDGQYQRAADELKKSIAAFPADPPPEGVKISSKRVAVDTINSQRLFLAMTLWQLGHKDESRRLLAETQAAIDEEFRSPTVFYNSRVALEVLRREAEALIEPKEADEAVEHAVEPMTSPSHENLTPDT